MTQITRKTSYKECQAIIDDPNSSPQLVEDAKKRQSEIKDWLKNKEAVEKAGSSVKNAEINVKELNTLKVETQTIIRKETIKDLHAFLYRIKTIEDELARLGIDRSPAFNGMLFNAITGQNQ